MLPKKKPYITLALILSHLCIIFLGSTFFLIFILCRDRHNDEEHNLYDCLFLFATGSSGRRSCNEPLNKAVHHPQVTKIVKIILERCTLDCNENKACTD